MSKIWQPNTVEDLAFYWLITYASAYKAPASIRRDEGMVRRQILPYFGKLPLQDIQVPQVERWLIELRDHMGLCEKSCNDALGLLRKLYNDAVRWGFVETNPVSRVRKFRLPELRYQHWTGKQVRQFLAYCESLPGKPRIYWPVALGLYTGMRRGELAALEWRSVDLSTGLITVCASYCRILKSVKPYTKSGRIRHVPINTKLRPILLDLHMAKGGPLVLPEINIDQYHRELAKLAESANLPVIKFHDLRHTFASNFLQNGGKLYDLQKILGHSTTQVTERYAHLVPEQLKGKTDVLEF